MCASYVVASDAAVDAAIEQYLGRHVVMELAAYHVPDDRRPIVKRLADEGQWSLFKPGAEVPRMLPSSPVLACLVGAPPARLTEPACAIIAAQDVRAAHAVLEDVPLAPGDAKEADTLWRAVIAAAARDGRDVRISWTYR